MTEFKKMVLVLGVIVMAASYAIKEQAPQPIVTAGKQQGYSARAVQQVELVKAFHEAGSPDAATMARAAMRTKRPALSAAQAIVESRGNIKARGKAGEKGAWQVREKYWGKVPGSAVKQALQNERIIEDLIRATGGLPLAVERYNGTGKKARVYSRKVLTLARRLDVLSAADVVGQSRTQGGNGSVTGGRASTKCAGSNHRCLPPSVTPVLLAKKVNGNNIFDDMLC